jgi:hypothetical protein
MPIYFPKGILKYLVFKPHEINRECRVGRSYYVNIRCSSHSLTVPVVMLLHCRVLHYSEYILDYCLLRLKIKFCCFPCNSVTKILFAMDHLLQFESLAQFPKRLWNLSN